jgi:hypothetical protein
MCAALAAEVSFFGDEIRVCGGLIIFSILSIGVIKVVPGVECKLSAFSPVFWFESLAVFSFAIAWLTKGEAILKDEQV